MAEADKDGRVAQIVSDLMATTAMAVSEGVRQAVEDFERFCPDCGIGTESASHEDCPNGPWSKGWDGEGRKRLRLTNALLETEIERDHWEAEHAAIFNIVLSEDAPVAIAKTFAGYDDLAWARLETFDRARLTAQGERVVEMFRQAIGG